MKHAGLPFINHRGRAHARARQNSHHIASNITNMFFEGDLPWQPVKPLADMLATQPTMIAGEAAFLLLAAISLLHACAHGRRHLMAYIGALVGGTANDIFFMVLPFVDNFFHAQGTFMLTPRLPLYIPAVYICFIYLPVVASWRLASRSVSARCAASALGGTLFYAPYDLTGAKFLWWSWHDTDAAVAARWLGVPIGSTLWTLIHGYCFHRLLHVFVLRHAAPLRASTAAFALLGLSLLCTPCMMLAMAPFQMHQLRLELAPALRLVQMPGRPWDETIADARSVVVQMPGRPDPPALALAVVTMLLTFASGSRISKDVSTSDAGGADALEREPPRRGLDMVLLAAALGTLLTLALAMALGEPANVVSLGLHQEYGACAVPDIDLSGYARTKYLCQAELDEDFHFGCVRQRLPPAQPKWYTICGKQHSNYGLYAGVTATLCALSGAMLTWMLLGVGGRRVTRAQQAKKD